MKLLKILKSDKPKKKFKAVFQLDNNKEKTIYFGASGYRDFTLMNDKNSKFYEPDKAKREKIKQNYLTRHKKDLESANNKKGLGAGALAFFVLWNKPTIQASINDYKKIYNL